MADKNIEIQIANRNYPLSIDEKEEDKLRFAAQLVNDNINKLKGDYVVTDYVDLLAMTALELAMGLDDESDLKSSAYSKTLDKELNAISSKIEEAIKASGTSS